MFTPAVVEEVKGLDAEPADPAIDAVLKVLTVRAAVRAGAKVIASLPVTLAGTLAAPPHQLWFLGSFYFIG